MILAIPVRFPKYTACGWCLAWCSCCVVAAGLKGSWEWEENTRPRQQLWPFVFDGDAVHVKVRADIEEYQEHFRGCIGVCVVREVRLWRSGFTKRTMRKLMWSLRIERTLGSVSEVVQVTKTLADVCTQADWCHLARVFLVLGVPGLMWPRERRSSCRCRVYWRRHVGLQHCLL